MQTCKNKQLNEYLCIEECVMGRQGEGVNQMSENCYCLFGPGKELDAEEDGVLPNKK